MQSNSSLQKQVDFITELFNLHIFNMNEVSNKEIVVFIGNTGAGKSTTINYLKKVSFKILDPTSQKIQYDPQDLYTKIGETLASETLTPKVIAGELGIEIFLDCPGFEDTRTEEERIFSMILLAQALKAAKLVKAVVIVVDINEFSQSKSYGFVKLTETLSKIFKLPRNIIDSCYFVITKDPICTGEELLGQIQKIHDQEEIFYQENESNNEYKDDLLLSLKKMEILKMMLNNPQKVIMLNLEDNTIRDDLLTNIRNSPGFIPGEIADIYDDRRAAFDEKVFQVAKEIYTEFENFTATYQKVTSLEVHNQVLGLIQTLLNLLIFKFAINPDELDNLFNRIDPESIAFATLKAEIQAKKEERDQMERDMKKAEELIENLTSDVPMPFQERKEAGFDKLPRQINYKGIPLSRVDKNIMGGELKNIKVDLEAGVYAAVFQPKDVIWLFEVVFFVDAKLIPGNATFIKMVREKVEDLQANIQGISERIKDLEDEFAKRTGPDETDSKKMKDPGDLLKLLEERVHDLEKIGKENEETITKLKSEIETKKQYFSDNKALTFGLFKLFEIGKYSTGITDQYKVKYEEVQKILNPKQETNGGRKVIHSCGKTFELKEASGFLMVCKNCPQCGGEIDLAALKDA